MKRKQMVRRSESEWAAIIAEQRASGLSQSSFCRQENIAESSFGYWQKKLKPEPEKKFIQVLPEKAPERKMEGKEIEISLPYGIVLKVRG